MKRKHVKCSGLSFEKSCNANGWRSQGHMAAPGMIDVMIQTPWYFNDHLSNQNFLETTQSLPRFLKNNIFPNSIKAVPGKMRKKDRKLKRLFILIKISKRVTWNCLGNCNSFGYVEVSSQSCVMTWMVAHFTFGLRNDATVNSFHAACTRQQQKQKASKPFLDTFRRPQVIDLWLFLLRSERTNAFSRCDHGLSW